MQMKYGKIKPVIGGYGIGADLRGERLLKYCQRRVLSGWESVAPFRVHLLSLSPTRSRSMVWENCTMLALRHFMITRRERRRKFSQRDCQFGMPYRLVISSVRLRRVAEVKRREKMGRAFFLSKRSSSSGHHKTNETRSIETIPSFPLDRLWCLRAIIDTDFVRRFHDCIVARVQDGYSFILVVGGGRTARNYIDAASKVHAIENDDQDWLGIHATHECAFFRTIFASGTSAHQYQTPRSRRFLSSKKSRYCCWRVATGLFRQIILRRSWRNISISKQLSISQIRTGVRGRSLGRTPSRNALTCFRGQHFVISSGTHGVWHERSFDPVASKLAEEEDFLLLF